VSIFVTATNTPPVITIPQNVYRIKTGASVSFPVRATDAEGEQQVTLSTLKEEVLGQQGNPATATFTFTPTSQQVGSMPFTFIATDDGFGRLRSEKTIIIQVEAVPKPNEWTLISYYGLLGLFNDTALYGEPVSLDMPGSPLNYMKTV
jgi:hypothetical protein